MTPVDPRLMVGVMPGWVVVAFYLAETLTFLLAMRWIGRAWLDKRWSARRVAVSAGLLTTLLVGLPAVVSAAGEGGAWIVALVLIAGLGAFLIYHNLALWTYAERHGVRGEMRRLADRNRSR